MRILATVLLGWLLVAGLACSRASDPSASGAAERARILERLGTPAPFSLDEAQASRFVALSLECTTKTFPNKPAHVYHDPAEVRPPAEVTPAFYGCFDWHSAVHGHWAMVRILKHWPELPEAGAIRARLDAHLSPEKLAAELAFLQQERAATFERPYGWAWLLRLYGELTSFDDADARRWTQALRPLAAHLSAQTRTYLDKLSTPIREGTHANTAFSLAHMLDAARASGDETLAQAIVARASQFYARDTGCPTDYEPSGEDFISPCLAEADLMRRVLEPGQFSRWVRAFLPAPVDPRFASLLAPPAVRDRHDPRIGHLIGLDFQRAWCFAGIASALAPDDDRRAIYQRLAAVHRQAGLEQMFDSGYGGSHWLASFAIYLLTEAGPYR